MATIMAENEYSGEPLAGQAGSPLLPVNGTSPQLEASRLIKSGAGLLFGFTCTNTNAAAQFVQLWDADAVPADGETTPILSKSVPGSDAVAFSWDPPRAMSQGIVICNSSTIEEKTIGSADCIFDVQFL